MKTLLVVDDERDILEAVRTVLEEEGYRVLTAENGRQGLDLLREARPDLVLMDIMMPQLSGLDVLKQMRAQEGLRDLPVVLMSAIRPAVAFDQYRWNAFLQKPFTLEKLLGEVRPLADGRTSRAER